MNLTLIKILLCASSLGGFVFAAQADELTPEKTADIRKFLTTSHAERMGEELGRVNVQTLLQSMKTCRNCTAQTFEIIERETLALFREKTSTPNGLIDKLLTVYHKNFSHSEIRQLLAFYDSPIGKRYLALSSKISQESLAVERAWSQSLSPIMQSRVKTALEKAKLPMPDVPDSATSK